MLRTKPSSAARPLRRLTFALLGCLALCLSGSAAARAQLSGEASWLPDQRVYERVSPADKGGGDVGGPLLNRSFAGARGQSSSDGNAVTYISFTAFGDSPSAELTSQYVSTRGTDSWSTNGISPPANLPALELELNIQSYDFFTSDLAGGLLSWQAASLVEAAPKGFDNLYIRAGDGSYRLVSDVNPPHLLPREYIVTFAGASPDLSHVVFEANDALAPGAPANARSLYEWAGSTLRLISILPGAGEVGAEGAGGGDGRDDYFANDVSADGSRIFWSDAIEQLYVREDGTTTVKLNASRRTATLGDGHATFRAATPSGSTAIFTDETALTDNPGDGGGLYSYDLESGALSDLAPNHGVDPEIRGVLGIGEDGSSVYFVAGASLAAGATAGEDNLYSERDGTIELIATLGSGDESDWQQSLDGRTARVTPDGDRLAFLSAVDLTGYDNTDANTGEPDSEVFVYDAQTQRLSCASCDPNGAPPRGPASVPGGLSASYMTRFLNDDGTRVFFDSPDALVARDSNQLQDVYEYEGGQISLISSGASDDISTFADASADGDDAFFTTRSQLLASDLDENSDMYDARVAGGFPAQAAGAAPCEREACLGPLSSPASLEAVATLTAGDTETHPPSTKAKAKAKKSVTKSAKKKKKKKKKKRGLSKRKARRRSTGSQRVGRASHG
jgi:hypothetical protein